MYGNWLNAAMALNRIEGLESRLKAAITNATKIFTEVNKIPGINISPLEGGSNIYHLKINGSFNGSKMTQELASKYNMRMAPPNADKEIMITVNETLLYREPDWIIDAFRNAIKSAG